MMRLHFERTGGFMGRTISLDLDLNDLSPPQAEVLRLLLDKANFLGLEEETPASDPARDVFNYLIMVETDDIRHTVRTSDVDMPTALRPLIEELNQLARTLPAR